MLREVALGLLSQQPAVADSMARRRCLSFPADEDRIEGPHGDSVVSTRCTVTEYQALDAGAAAKWTTAVYRWTSVFTAESAPHNSSARDTVIEEEIVVFAEARPGQMRAVWHDRFEDGVDAVWRSITPELATPSAGTTLLSAMYCLNGSGGCGQEFLLRHANGRWAPVWQVWLDQLPASYVGRIRHGVRIDLRTLRGEAGFYGDGDANCCPSETLRIELGLRGDSLVLLRQSVVAATLPTK